jgi:2-oxoglutarate dehydrogenase complex dehydrogenase (E1) component-like enzyme
MRGHKVARLDPLEISSVNLDSERPKDLNLTFFNFRKIRD